MAQQDQGLRSFFDEIGRVYSSGHPDTFWACRPSLEKLIAQGSIQLRLNAELKAVVEDDQFFGNWLPNEFLLQRYLGTSLSVVLLDEQRRYIHALPYFAFYVPLAGSLTYDRYRLPVGYRNDVFDASLKLELLDTQTARIHEPIQIESDRYAYDLKISAPTPVLRFATLPVTPMEWLFSKNSLLAWQANDADLSYTQLRVAAYVLGKIAHQSSVGPLRDLACHSHHAVRWSAIQNLGRLSRSEALVAIRRALNDPHPHVRRAAQKTLDRLEAKREK